MKVEYNTDTSVLPTIISGEDIVRTMHITMMKALNWKIKNFQDNKLSYCGEEDVWMFPAVATRAVTIPKGTRICQFRIQLSQKATRWQKIKWLFSGKPKLKPVTELHNPKRGGIGEGTGV